MVDENNIKVISRDHIYLFEKSQSSLIEFFESLIEFCVPRLMRLHRVYANTFILKL